MNKWLRLCLGILAVVVALACYSVAQQVYTPMVTWTIENQSWQHATVSLYCSGVMFRRIARVESGQKATAEFAVGYCRDARIGIRQLGSPEWYSDILLIRPDSDVTIIIPQQVYQTFIMAI